jgi:hypothetical protein
MPIGSSFKSFGRMVALLLGLPFAAPAAAAENPHLVASGVFGEMQACGSSSIIVAIGKDSAWINYLDGRQIQLDAAIPDRTQTYVIPMLVCSPNGRWIMMQYNKFEEGDPTCESLGKDFPVVVVWDTESKNHRVVGRGYFSFIFSPDGSALIYSRRLICNLDKDKRTSIDLSQLSKKIKTMSGDDITRMAEPNGHGDRLGIAMVRWLGPDRVVAQLSPDEGEDGDPGRGALVLVSQVLKPDASVAQLNPARFRTSRVLDRPQLSQAVSDDLLQKAGCGVGDHESDYVACTDERALHGEPVQLDQDVYCKDERAKDAAAFCAVPVSEATWMKYRIGSHTLLSRQRDRSAIKSDLFIVTGSE